MRQQDNDWRQLEAATRRPTLPADTPARLYPLRDSAAAAAQQMRPTTTSPQRRKNKRWPN